MKYLLFISIILAQALLMAQALSTRQISSDTTQATTACIDCELSRIDTLSKSLTLDLKNLSQTITTNPAVLQNLNDPQAKSPELYRSTTIPLHLKSSDETLIAGTAAVITAIMLTPKGEQTLLKEIQSHKSPEMDKVMNVGKKFGEKPGVLLAGASMVYAIVVDDNKHVKNVIPVQLEAILAAGLANNLLKIAFHRALPEDSPNDAFAKGKSNNPARLAFPSGHTTSALVAATLISENFKGQSDLVPVIAYSAAALTAVSRTYHNQHWVTDVLASLYAHYLTKSILNKDKESKSKLVLTPTFNDKGYGVNMVYYGQKYETGQCGKKLSGMSRVERCIIEATMNK